MQRVPTGWAVVKQTRDGTPAPDGEGVPIWSIGIILIRVKTIIIMLYQFESAPTPPSTFPHQHMGIANSGSSGFYFSCGAPVANYNPRPPTVGVMVANWCPEHSVASATLASVSTLPPSMKSGHVMPSFLHTLIGLGPFANQGCKIVFNKTSVTVFHPDG
jgi:hypothetical protein